MVGAAAFSWRRDSAGWLRRPASLVAAPAALLALLALGYFSPHHLDYALLGGGAILVIGLAATNMRFFALLAVPCTLLVVRVGGGSSGLSASDLVLFVGALSALPLVRLKESPELRRLLWLMLIYEVAILPTVVDNLYRADAVEWVHELLLVGGSLVAGFVVGRAGKARAAFSAYLFGSCIIAGWTCVMAVKGHFRPVQLPLGMQKNYIGDMLAFAVVLAYAKPDWVGWRGKWTRGAIGLCLLGILGSQSKQAMISCAAGVIVVALRGRQRGRRSKFVLAAMVPILIIAYEMVKHEVVSNNSFNSVHQRETWYHESLTIWRLSEWFGVGLRWWYTNRFSVSFQPPNAEIEMLTSAGVVGVAAFLLLMLGALWVLWRLPPAFGTLAFSILLMRFIQGQLDIFWVGAQGSLPWLVAGVAIGAMCLQRAGQPPPRAAGEIRSGDTRLEAVRQPRRPARLLEPLV
jgi:polysaccharide biosynthesis protein PslJ